jgi:PEP-CTERM motif
VNIRFWMLNCAVLLCWSAAQAAIVHVAIPAAEQEFLGLGQQVSRDFDFDHDGRNDVRFSTGAAGFGVRTLHAETGITTGGEIIGANFLGQTAVPLLYGMQINRYTELFPDPLQLYPGVTVYYGIGITATTANTYLLSYGALDGSSGGVWYGREAYMGFALLPGNDFNFGWLRIREFGGFGGYFLEYAYETEPNVPIFAGQVPEPSSVLLVALGSAGSLLRRRRDLRRLRNSTL